MKGYKMKKLMRALKWLAIHLGAFLLVIWFFMGINPQEAYQKTSNQLAMYISTIKGGWNDFSDASVRLGKKANKYGLQEAENVRQGKDYYEGYKLQ